MDWHEWSIANEDVGVWMLSTDGGCAAAIRLELRVVKKSYVKDESNQSSQAAVMEVAPTNSEPFYRVCVTNSPSLATLRYQKDSLQVDIALSLRLHTT